MVSAGNETPTSAAPEASTPVAASENKVQNHELKKTWVKLFFN